VESLCILPYTSVNVRVVDGQRLKFNAVNGQSPKIRVKTPKRAGQSFDLAVAAVTIESMGVTPPVEAAVTLLKVQAISQGQVT